MVVLRIGPTSEINVFQIDGNDEAARPDADLRPWPARSLRVPGGVARPVRRDPGRADAARVQRRVRHRLRPRAQRVLPRSGGPRARDVRREPRRDPGPHQPAGHTSRPLPRRLNAGIRRRRTLPEDRAGNALLTLVMMGILVLEFGSLGILRSGRTVGANITTASATRCGT